MAVSDKPWGQFSAGDYTPEQYAAACLVVSGDRSVKDNCHLPVREPDGTLNRNACHAAAASLAGARGGVQIPPDAKRSAARKLVSLYRGQLKEDPPPSLSRMAA